MICLSQIDHVRKSRLAQRGDRYTVAYVDGHLREVALLGSVHDARGELRAAERRLRRHMRRTPWGQRGTEYYDLLNARDRAWGYMMQMSRAPRYEVSP